MKNKNPYAPRFHRTRRFLSRANEMLGVLIFVAVGSLLGLFVFWTILHFIYGWSLKITLVIP